MCARGLHYAASVFISIGPRRHAVSLNSLSAHGMVPLQVVQLVAEAGNVLCLLLCKLLLKGCVVLLVVRVQKSPTCCVATEPDDLHAVQQGPRDGVKHICRAHEERLQGGEAGCEQQNNAHPFALVSFHLLWAAQWHWQPSVEPHIYTCPTCTVRQSAPSSLRAQLMLHQAYVLPHAPS